MPTFSEWRLRERWRRLTGLRLDPWAAERLAKAVRERLASGPGPGDADQAIERALDAEWAALADAVTVRESSFFRHPRQWHALAGYARETLARHAGTARGGCVRAWSAGCASGEEAYTLAAVLRDALPPPWRVSVLGTDISREAIAGAEAGEYAARTLRSAPVEFVRRHFVERGGGFAVRDELRQLVEFRCHNLMQPLQTGAAFDVVFCRNVLIYLEPEAKRIAIANLRRAADTAGLLFFGPADVLVGADGLTAVHLGGIPAYRVSRRPPLAAPGYQSARKDPPPPRPALPPPAPRADDTTRPATTELWRDAEGALATGDLLRASGLLEAILERDPNHVDSLIEQALMLAGGGAAEHAMELCDALLASGAGNAEAFATAGIVVDAAGDPQSASQLLERAVTIDDSFAEAHLLRAAIAARSGQVAVRSAALEQALRALRAGERPHQQRRLRRFAAGFSAESLLQTVVQQCRDSGLAWEQAS